MSASCVFLVYHMAYEEDQYVRGVFATREIAMAHLVAPKVLVYGGHETWDCDRHVYWVTHDAECCSVEEWAVEVDIPSAPEAETPPHVPDPDPLLDAFYDSLPVTLGFDGNRGRS